MSSHTPVVTVDGPSGAGKGTLCMLLANKLGFQLLDSGAIYRVLALAAIHMASISNQRMHWFLSYSFRCSVCC